jgi:hypothetical protein
MRPTPDQILASMSHTLTEHVIPYLQDDYATYVAKVMRHVIAHLRVRDRLEGEQLATENRELIALLRGLETAPPGIAALAADAVADLTDADTTYTPVARLAARNARLRTALVGTIEALDADADGFGDADAQAALRAGILAHTMAQAERDAEIAEPAFLSFAPRSAS